MPDAVNKKNGLNASYNASELENASDDLNHSESAQNSEKKPDK